MSSWKTKNEPSTATMNMRNSVCVFSSDDFAASLSGCLVRWDPFGPGVGFMFSSLREQPPKLDQCAS